MITDLSRKNGRRYRSCDGRNTDPPRKNGREYRTLVQGIPTPDASFGPFLPSGSAQGAYVGGQNGGRDDRDRRVPTKPHDTDPSRKVSWPVAAKRRTFCRADGHNTDPWHNEYRPRAQRIPTPRAKNTDPARRGILTSRAREYRPPAQKRARIPTPRARNTDLLHKSALEKACKYPDFDYCFRFPCCICSCLMSCCTKNGRMWDGEA